MSKPALIAETTEDGRVKYEYRDHGAAYAIEESPEILKQGNREIQELYVRKENPSEVESLEKFVTDVLGKNRLIMRVWIDGKCYDKIPGKPIIVECRKTRESSQDFMSEYGTLNEESLAEADREVIDFR